MIDQTRLRTSNSKLQFLLLVQEPLRKLRVDGILVSRWTNKSGLVSEFTTPTELQVEKDIRNTMPRASGDTLGQN